MRFASRRRGRAAGWVFVSLAALPAAGGPLFPEPLHLRREIHDPITSSTTTLDEYCSGNRIVTIQGARLVIADYERNELTEIDHAAATFSITSFADLTRAAESLPVPTDTNAASELPEARVAEPRRSSDGRMLETYEFRRDDPGRRLKIEVAVDRSITVSPTGLEALIGASFPNRRSSTHDAILRAASRRTQAGPRLRTDAVEALALPMEQAITYELGGEEVTFRSSVVAVDHDSPPPELLVIPPGATRVESKRIAVPRLLQEIERVP